MFLCPCKTSQHEVEWSKKFLEALKRRPEILEAHRLAGDIDYILKVEYPTRPPMIGFINPSLEMLPYLMSRHCFRWKSLFTPPNCRSAHKTTPYPLSIHSLFSSRMNFLRNEWISEVTQQNRSFTEHIFLSSSA